MKKIIVIVFLFFTVSSFSQTGSYLRAIIFNSNVYKTKVDLKLTQFSNIDGKLITTKEFTLIPKAEQSIRYKIVGTDGNYTIIRLLPNLKINSDNSITVGKPTNAEDDASKFTYFVETKNFGVNQKIMLSEKIVGTPLLFPYKLRLQDKGEGAIISTEFTVGYTFGLRLKTSKIPYKQNFFTVIPYGFGLCATKYYYQKADGTLSDKKDAVAITYYTGGGAMDNY